MELPPNQFGAIDEGATRALGTYQRRSTLTDTDNAKAQRVMSESQMSAGPRAYDVYRTWTLTEPVGPYSLFGRPPALGSLPDMYIDRQSIKTSLNDRPLTSYPNVDINIGPYQLATRAARDVFGVTFPTPSGEQTYSSRNVWRRRG